MKEIIASVSAHEFLSIAELGVGVLIKKTAPKCNVPTRLWFYIKKTGLKLFVDGGKFVISRKAEGRKLEELLNGRVAGAASLDMISWQDIAQGESAFAIANRNPIDFKGCDKASVWHFSDFEALREPKSLTYFHEAFKLKPKAKGPYPYCTIHDVYFGSIRQETRFGWEYARPIIAEPRDWMYAQRLKHE